MKFVREMLQAVHVGALAIKMNRQQGAELVVLAAAQKRFDLIRIEIECPGIDVGKYGPRAGPHDGARRSKKTKWRGEYLISRLHSGGSESEPQGVGAGSATDRVACPTETGEFAFESFDLRPKNVLLRCANPLNRRQYLVLHLQILAMQIEQGHAVEALLVRCGLNAWVRRGRFGLGRRASHRKRDCSRLDGWRTFRLIPFPIVIFHKHMFFVMAFVTICP